MEDAALRVLNAVNKSPCAALEVPAAAVLVAIITAFAVDPQDAVIRVILAKLSTDSRVAVPLVIVVMLLPVAPAPTWSNALTLNSHSAARLEKHVAVTLLETPPAMVKTLHKMLPAAPL